MSHRPTLVRLPSPGEPHAFKQTSYPALKDVCLNDPRLPPSPPYTPLKGTFQLPVLTPSDITPETIPVVAVIGTGYVGTHLIEVFASQYKTLGFDISDKRLNEIHEQFAINNKVELTSEASRLAYATHYLISVPTLLLPDKSIDLSYLRGALATVSEHARPGATIVVESSVAVGMTRELLGPIALRNNCFVGMSPERVDPGRTCPAAHQIPKVVSGLDDVVPGSLAQIVRLYERVFDCVVPVSKPEVAEMTKLYKNCQRMMCIAYANEMANACEAHDIDPYEVCDAAATKPFGYMPYSPGPGVGGHCIPVNPYYLLSNNDFPILQAATEAMWQRPLEHARKCLADMRDANPETLDPSHLSRVLVVGVGFKPGQSTLSNSPGLALIRGLVDAGDMEINFADSMVSQEMVPWVPKLDEQAWTRGGLEEYDMIIVTMRQVGHDFSLLHSLQHPLVKFLCR
ncbi:hypothetical protein NLU13_0645 [Sarocladium strictum]|uniref:Nucleotide sugar dehydrogenase n=1 Tax=Sarocladium strictum TaxID=5046 RepID=A0AA39LBG8_SARSR|nr:hypothetical protein NLU13_0645 [Sarocladium strictum]